MMLYLEGFIKQITLLFFLIFPMITMGQLKIAPVKPAFTHLNDVSGHARIQENDTLELPFWDDFSYNRITPNPDLWLHGEEVHVSRNMAINPPTLGVATFDGARNSASIYNPDPFAVGLADTLVSKPINLGALQTDDDVYLSFFWQYFGNVEIPDEEDSLRLLFRNQQSEWEVIDTFTKERVIATDTFLQVIYRLDQRFLYGSFQFKFEVFARLSGPYDSWHIDYIYLDKNRNLLDKFYFDRAISTTPEYIFNEYSAIPINQFFVNPEKYIRRSAINIYNLDNFLQPIEYTAQLKNTHNQSETIDVLNFNTEVNPILQGQERREIFFNPLDIQQLNPDLDSIYMTLDVYISSGDSIIGDKINYRRNDSTSAEFVLHNFYATDDGTAEFGLGLEQKGGKVAYMFVLEETDVLNRVDIHFPNIGRDQAGTGFSLFVWDKLSGDERDVIYERENLAIDPISQFNQFQSIRLPELFVSDTIFIGWEQYSTDFMSVGFDKNHDSGHKIFYNSEGSWEPNEEFHGSLMLRPYFGEAEPTAVKIPVKEDLNIRIYPNPTPGIITIEGDFEYFHLYDLKGRLIFKDTYRNETQYYDLQKIPEGMYILRIIDKHRSHSQRLLISR